MTTAQNLRELLGKSLKASLGLFLYSFGVHLTVKADIGLAPWDVFAMGLSNHIPFTFGQATMMISIIIVIIDLLLREEIGLGTILDAIIVGVGLDLFEILNFVPTAPNYFVSVLYIVIGLFIMAYSQYLYMSACIACGPRDTFLVGIGKRLKKLPIGAVSVIEAIVVLVIGWLLGGPVGPGTVLTTGCTGIAMQIVFRILKFEPRNLVHEGILGTVRRFKK